VATAEDVGSEVAVGATETAELLSFLASAAAGVDVDSTDAEPRLFPLIQK
jgi:hypothetical protein